MPIVIGAKPESNFQDPIGLLTDCHRRVKKFAMVLRHIGDLRGSLLDAEQRSALDTALRYFREAAPKHTADEESSLFPRLRIAAATGDPSNSVLDSLDSLEADHDVADAMHAEVDSLGLRWLADGVLRDADADRFAWCAGALVDLYERHIAVEENSIFPTAAGRLGKEELTAVGLEMAARRGIKETLFAIEF